MEVTTLTKGVRILKGHYGYFIYSHINHKYWNKDGCWSSSCGNGWFDTVEEARDNYFKYNKRIICGGE